MNNDNVFPVTRRKFLQVFGAGAIVVSFNLSGALQSVAHAADKPLSMFDLEGHIKNAPGIDSWLRIDNAGNITFSLVG